MDKPKIRKVKWLKGELKTRAIECGFDEEDLVIVKVNGELEKIEGSIMSFLEDNYLEVL